LRTEATPGIDGFVSSRRLADVVVRSDGSTASLEQLDGKMPVVAIAAIARPDAFFDMLRARGIELARTVRLPDHADFEKIESCLPKDATLLCTAKDAVKLWRLRPDALSVPLVLDIEPAFWEEFDRLLPAKLSSAHGSETA
jgi:tetraacyldisaccharide 4'-kinase